MKGHKEHGEFHPHNHKQSAIHASDVSQNKLRIKKTSWPDLLHRYREAKRTNQNPTLVAKYKKELLEKMPEHEKIAFGFSDREDFYKEDEAKGNRYEIVRFYRESGKRPRIINSGGSNMGLTRREAEAHASNPKTRKEGVYFDGFAKLGSY